MESNILDICSRTHNVWLRISHTSLFFFLLPQMTANLQTGFDVSTVSITFWSQPTNQPKKPYHKSKQRIKKLQTTKLYCELCAKTK